MNKNIFACCIIIIFLCSVLVGCTSSELQTSSSDTEKIIGTWRAQDEEYYYRGFTFKEDGTCTINTYEMPGTYEIGNGTLTVTNLDNHMTYTYTYVFSSYGEKLTLNNQDNYESIKFVKQEE